MDDPSENLRHISCLLCRDQFPYLGPKYSEHLYKCHGVMKESRRAYLVKVTNYKIIRGELPEIKKRIHLTTSPIAMFISPAPVWTL